MHLQRILRPLLPVTFKMKTEMIAAEKRVSSDLSSNEFADLTLLQSLKRWRLIAFYCLGMSSAILMYGYDYVIIGTVSAMPSFQ